MALQQKLGEFSFRYRSRPLQQFETIVTDLTSGNRFLYEKEENTEKRPINIFPLFRPF